MSAELLDQEAYERVTLVCLVLARQRAPETDPIAAPTG